MTFQEYENMIRTTRIQDHDDLIYATLGLAGEAGEATDKIKKLWRNSGITSGSALNPEQRDGVLKELGDCLWYLTALALTCGVTLEQVMQMNAEKCLSRKERGVTKGEGDNR
jgi:NTP pyrophosphatase (non-canonical NTP hydrolase)